MCNHVSFPSPAAMLSASLSEAFPGGRRLPDPESSNASAAKGSRRYRLWELPSHTHCPLIGVCLPMPVLRRLVAKALGSSPDVDDYDFHVAAVNECGRRMPIAEALQRELDRRYAADLRRFARAKTNAALEELWASSLQSPGVAGALWATLSHPRCGHALRERVCHDIHMFQHQIGACNRADLQRLERLQDENSLLAADLADLRERHARILAQRTAQAEKLNAELMRARSQAITHASTIAFLRDRLTELETAAPGLPDRPCLERRLEMLQHRLGTLERERSEWRQRAEQEAAQARGLADQLAAARASHGPTEPEPDGSPPADRLADLRDMAVLCVGGRPASVPVYRQLIECTGGRFLHHDGGEEDSDAQLDASLSAADLVICQTGCVSHGAYWRVKDYCKRTGKRCLYIDKPSASSLQRRLRELA